MNKEIPAIPYSKKIKVDKSKIHGLGIIAKRNIKKGEIVFIIKGKEKHWQIKSEKDALYGDCWIGIKKNLWIDPKGFGRFINHSGKPNCGIRGKLLVCAMRNIKKGEEATIDYSTTEEEPLWWMKNGIDGKIIKSIQSIPLKKYKSYLPFVPKYFQMVYNNFHNLKRRE